MGWLSKSPRNLGAIGRGFELSGNLGVTGRGFELSRNLGATSWVPLTAGKLGLVGRVMFLDSEVSDQNASVRLDQSMTGFML